MVGQVASQVFADCDGPHTRAPAAVGDGEGLVQVEVADVGAEASGLRQPDQGVHVRPVDVDLAAGGVHQLAGFDHRVLEDAVGRRIGHHDGGQPVGVGVDLVAQVGHVDRAVVGGPDHHDLQPGQGGGRGVRAMGRRRDQTDFALRFAASQVVAPDGDQPRELTLGTRVGLQAHPVVAGDLDEPSGEFVDHLAGAAGVGRRDERVQVGEARVADRLQLGCRIELHGAAAQRDHPTVEGEVASGQRGQVAHHLGLGMV